MVLAFSYKRFSTPEQEKGDSTRRQDAGFTALCTKHGLTPAGSYFDRGTTGWKPGKQKDLQRFLDLLESGEVPKGSWLVIESLDRASRQGHRKTVRLLEVIIENGCVVATTNPERIYDLKSLDDPLATVEILLIASRAKEESDRKSERVKAAAFGRHKRAKETGQAVTARGPYWLELVNGKWRVVPAHVKTIKQIFKWASENGLGQRAIAKRLNAARIPGFKNGKWGWAMVRNILTDGRVIGVFKSKLGEIANYYPSVIDEADFLKVQALTKKRIRFRGRTSERIANLFTGLAFDKDSGSTMVYVKKGKTIEARWVPSIYETQGKSAGKSLSFNYDLFENLFLQFTKELTLKEVNGHSPQTSKEEGELESQLAKLELRIEDTTKALTDISLAIKPDEAVQALSDLSQQKQVIVKKLEELKSERNLQSPVEALSQSQTIIEKLDKAKGQELVDLRSQLRQAIRNLVSRIDVQLHRKGWITSLLSFITFQNGHRRLLAIKTIRGKLEIVVTNAKDWTDGDMPKELLIA